METTEGFAGIEYDSNPFTLSFNSLGKFFNKNVAWAIVIIAFGLLGAISNTLRFVTNVNTIDNNPDSAYSDDSGYLPYSEDLIDQKTGEHIDPAVLGGVVVGVIAVATVFGILFALVATFVGGMFVYVALQNELDRSVSFKEAFDATMQRFGRLFIAQLLAGLKIFAWSLLLIVPGIIAALRYSLLPYVVMADGPTTKGVGKAHDDTKKLVAGRLWEIVGIATVSGIIPVVGQLLQLGGLAAAHNQLKAYNESGKEKPKIHFLNYLGVLLLAGVLMIIVLVLVLIGAIIIANKS